MCVSVSVCVCFGGCLCMFVSVRVPGVYWLTKVAEVELRLIAQP